MSANLPNTPGGEHANELWRRYEFNLRELDIMQEVIARHERHAFAVKAFLGVVMTGLAAMAFSLKIDLPPWVFLLLGVAAVLGFGLWAIAHKVVAEQAIARAQELQRLYLNGTPPDATETVGKHLSSGWRHLLNLRAGPAMKATLHPTNILPLLVAALVVGSIYWLKESMANRTTVTGREVLLSEGDEATLSGTAGGLRCTYRLKRNADGAGARWVLVGYDCRE